VGSDGEDPRKWRWDRGQQLLEVHDSDLLFQLGTTSRSRFTLETGITQAPWTGNVGVFWGYREDAAVKSARTAGKEFAWFQTVCVWHRVAENGGDRYSVRRGRCAASYDRFGELQVDTHFSSQHEVPRLERGEKVLRISVEGKRLTRALLGPVELTSLCSDAVNKSVEAEPYQGGVGVVALSHQGTFANARFLAHAGD
jgi:hypothetical protein